MYLLFLIILLCFLGYFLADIGKKWYIHNLFDKLNLPIDNVIICHICMFGIVFVSILTSTDANAFCWKYTNRASTLRICKTFATFASENPINQKLYNYGNNETNTRKRQEIECKIFA